MNTTRTTLGAQSGTGPRRALAALWALALAGLVWAAMPAALAQEAADAPPADRPGAAAETGEPTPASSDPNDPATPEGAVRSFIDLSRAGDYRAAAAFLDLSAVPPAERGVEGPRLARLLKIVLDRRLWVHYEKLSSRPEGLLDDGLPPDLESIGALEGTGIEILLQRVEQPDGSRVWKFAPGTVARIPALQEQYGYGPLGEWLPAPLVEFQLLELRLWQWIGLLLLVAGSLLGGWIAVRVLYWILRPIVARTQTQLDDLVLGLVSRPLVMAFALLWFTPGTYLLVLAAPVYTFLGNLEKGLAVVVVTWIAFRVVDVVAALAGERMEQQERRAALAAIPLGRRAAKVVLVAVAVIAVLQNLGFNVTGLIATLGVGGLAVALAAQKSVENLFGGITLIADQPVRVGDFCRFGEGKVGTVEEVGLRSTRVRTLDRTLVTVPNSQFSEFDLENYAMRDRIRLATTLGLRYETTPDQLRHVLAELRKVLITHPKVSNDPARVRFSTFGAYSLDIEVFAYVETTDFAEFCAIREDLFLRFMDVVAASGTGFAFPSQTLYLGRDGGLDAAAGRRAAEQVETWRREGALPFPDFAEETVSSLSGTGDWPPRGSATPPQAD